MKKIQILLPLLILSFQTFSNVEVKSPIDNESFNKVISGKLGQVEKDKSKSIYFVDTPDFKIQNNHGVILRIRSEKKKNEYTVKLRGLSHDEMKYILENSESKMKKHKFKCETDITIDQKPKHSCSLKYKSKKKKEFSQNQYDFIRKFKPAAYEVIQQVNSHLKNYGPIKSQSYLIETKDLKTPLEAEVWSLNGKQYFEISIKGNNLIIEEKLRDFRDQNQLIQLQRSTKTSWAKELFSM